MTDKRLPPNGVYRQIYYKGRSKPYTSSKVPEDDYLVTPVWRELREKRLLLDNYRCKMCGTGINVAVHHIRYPFAWGEENVFEDLVTLCDTCHARVHKNDIAKETKHETVQ